MVLHYTGVAEGTATVAALASAAEIAAADVVIVALPAPAYANVLPLVAPHLRSGQTAFVSGALSLAPLWLAELAAAHGMRPVISASGTTVANGRTRRPATADPDLSARLR